MVYEYFILFILLDCLVMCINKICNDIDGYCMVGCEIGNWDFKCGLVCLVNC